VSHNYQGEERRQQCYITQTIFNATVGIIIIILSFMGSAIIANDQRTLSYIIPMKESLARIETKVDEHMRAQDRPITMSMANEKEKG
jgi:hypothetical protein